jgi:cholesterol transport system auxiliary component
MNFSITFRRIALLCACLAFTGCLSRPALVQHTYALQSPPSNVKSNRGDAVLSVEACRISPLFAGRSLVYRTGPDVYESDPYANFLVTPDRVMDIPIRGYLRNSGIFKDVLEPGSSLKPDQVVEIHVGEFYGDLRKNVPPAAVLSLRFTLIAAEGGNGQPLFQKDYSQRCPIGLNTADAVVGGWNQALGMIMKQVAIDLRKMDRSPLTNLHPPTQAKTP